MEWHPFHDLEEVAPGHWELHTRPSSVGWADGRKYGDIRLVRNRGVAGYRCLMLPGMSARPVDLGLAPSLRDAAELVHTRWKESYGR